MRITAPSIVKAGCLAALTSMVSLVPAAAQVTGQGVDVSIKFSTGGEGGLYADVGVKSPTGQVLYGELAVLKNGVLVRRVPIQTSSLQQLGVRLGEGMQLVDVRAVFKGMLLMPGHGTLSVTDEAQASFRQAGIARPSGIDTTILRRAGASAGQLNLERSRLQTR